MKKTIRFSVRLVLTLLTGIVLPGIVVKTIQASSWLALGLASVFCIAGAFSIYVAFRPSALDWLMAAELEDHRLEPFHLVLPPFLFIGVFMALCYTFWQLYPGAFVVPEDPVPSMGLQWALFVVDHVARAVFLDLFEIFQIHISAIRYNGILPSVIVFVFRTVLALVFWKTLIGMFIRFRRHQANGHGK